MLLTLNTLCSKSFSLYIIMLFDKTGICAVQEHIKIYHKLKCTVHLIGNNCELPIQTAVFSNPSPLPPAEVSHGGG